MVHSAPPLPLLHPNPRSCSSELVSRFPPGYAKRYLMFPGFESALQIRLQTATIRMISGFCCADSHVSLHRANLISMPSGAVHSTFKARGISSIHWFTVRHSNGERHSYKHRKAVLGPIQKAKPTNQPINQSINHAEDTRGSREIVLFAISFRSGNRHSQVTRSDLQFRMPAYIHAHHRERKVRQGTWAKR